MDLLVRNVLTGLAERVTIARDGLRRRPDPGPPPDDLHLGPGWTDLQVNGFAGFDFNGPEVAADTVESATRRLWQEGVAAFLPTLITAASPDIETGLRTIAEACERSEAVRASVLGVHLEGPYISPIEGARGAHPADQVRPPDWQEFERWQRLSGKRIRLVTLAPEWPEAADFIARATAAGVVVALGHTVATGAAIARAVANGARLSTHLGNGAPATLPRHPNFLWDQLADDRLTASFIFDGHHLPPNVMKVFVRAKGVGRSILVSDASALAHLPPGRYTTPIGNEVVLEPSGRIALAGTGYLAASASSLKEGIENAVRLAGCSLAEAVTMASVNPTTLLNEPPRDNATLFRRGDDDRIEVLATVVDGRVVYRAASLGGGELG